MGAIHDPYRTDRLTCMVLKVEGLQDPWWRQSR